MRETKTAAARVCAPAHQSHQQQLQQQQHQSHQQQSQQNQPGTKTARAWLHRQLVPTQPACVAAAKRSQQQHHHLSADQQGRTVSCFRRGTCQNMLTAVMYPHAPTGYKDNSNPANRSDRHNGGEFRCFESTTAKAFAAITDRPIQFRRDGLPVSAVRVPGKPLMAPKLPSAADLGLARQRAAAGRRSSITFISPGAASSPARHFQSVSQLVFTAPHRSLIQPNPGIAADDAKRGRRQLGLLA